MSLYATTNDANQFDLLYRVSARAHKGSIDNWSPNITSWCRYLYICKTLGFTLGKGRVQKRHKIDDTFKAKHRAFTHFMILNLAITFIVQYMSKALTSKLFLSFRPKTLQSITWWLIGLESRSIWNRDTSLCKIYLTLDHFFKDYVQTLKFF